MVFFYYDSIVRILFYVISVTLLGSVEYQAIMGQNTTEDELQPQPYCTLFPNS